jgi:hypothetical protein
MIIWGAAALEDDAFIAGIFELGLSITEFELLSTGMDPPEPISKTQSENHPNWHAKATGVRCTKLVEHRKLC